MHSPKIWYVAKIKRPIVDSLPRAKTRASRSVNSVRGMKQALGRHVAHKASASARVSDKYNSRKLTRGGETAGLEMSDQGKHPTKRLAPMSFACSWLESSKAVPKAHALKIRCVLLS